jgi:non-heme chloroperoxidase
MIEKFTNNGGIRIRYLDSGPAARSGAPVVFVPGITDLADDYLPMFECFGDRRLLIVELRGRGGSDAPSDGYSALEQATDVEAVIHANDIVAFHLMTFSRGTTPGLEVAMKLTGHVLSVCIGDYLPAEIGLPVDFADRMLATTWRGVPVGSRVPRHVLDGIQAASRSRELWDGLAAVGVPVLVARGSEGGVINDEVEARYRRSVADIEVVTIGGSGHDLFRPSRTAYPSAVLDFVGRREADAAGPGGE